MAIIIDTNRIQFNCVSIETAQQMKSEVEPFLRERFFPKLEELIEQYDTSPTTWVIDHIPLSLEIKNKKQWKNEFLHQSLTQVRSYLRTHSHEHAILQTSNKTSKPHGERHSDWNPLTIFLNFLKTGSLGSKQHGKTIQQLAEDIEWTEQNRVRVFESMNSDSNSILRFVFSLPERTRETILGKKKLRIKFFQEERRSSIDQQKIRYSQLHDFFELINQLNATPQNLSEQFPDILATYFGIDLKQYHSWFSLQTEEVQVKLENWIKINDEFKETEDEKAADFRESRNVNRQKFPKSYLKSDSNNEEEKLNDVFYIQNGGLILLYPFLQNLFLKLDYLQESKEEFVSKKMQNRAVLLSQYLLNFEERIFENELILNKILCGVKPENVINTQVEFTDKERKMCEELLISVIAHWKILKNTSPKGLQESFLERNAKLEMKNKQWFLSVEGKGIDLLLNHLPWGIGTVKTPWMEEYLSCKWI